jgi:hypothetical protein
MGVRAPERWSCKPSEALLGRRLQHTRNSGGTAGFGGWSSAEQEEGLNFLLRKYS